MSYQITVRKNLKLFSALAITASLLFTACKKDDELAKTNTLLQQKWVIEKRVANFPTNTTLNFTDFCNGSDYLDFKANGIVTSYITLYLPYSKDTATYSVSGNTITVQDNRQYGIIFQHQNSNGGLETTTSIKILSLTETALKLEFPTLASISGGSTVTYYPGTLTYYLYR